MTSARKKRGRPRKNDDVVIETKPTNRTNADGDVIFETAPPKADDGKRATWPKSWVLIFTFAVTWTIHLEVVKDFSVTAYWYAIQTIFARRGISRKFRSDNAKQHFYLAEAINQFMWNDVVWSGLTNEGIEWQLTPPSLRGGENSGRG